MSKMLTEILKKAFLNLGLKEEHLKVYAANLSLGSSGAGGISKKSLLPRSTAYLILEDLKKFGLVSQAKTESKIIFTPENPKQILSLLEGKEKSINDSKDAILESLSVLEAEYFGNKPKFPKVRFYEGAGGLKVVYYDCLSAPELLVLCQGSFYVETSLKDDPQYLKDFIEEAASRRLKCRELLEDTPATREYKKKYESETDLIRLLPSISQNKIGHVDKHIYDGKIAYISHDNLIGVIIEDRSLYEAEKAIFEVLWKQQKPTPGVGDLCN